MQYRTTFFFFVIIILVPKQGITDLLDEKIYQTSGEYQKILITLDRNEVTNNSVNDAYSFPDSTDSNISPRNNEIVNKIISKYNLEKLENWPIYSLNIQCIIFKIKNDEHPIDKLLKKISLEPEVKNAQLLQNFFTLSNLYNDPYIDNQISLEALEISSLHKLTTGKGVKIAIVDSGVDSNHPELKKRIKENRNFVGKLAKNKKAEVHGTAIAGIIAAQENNREGIVGIAPDAKIYALRACWEAHKNSNESARCNSLTLAQAIDYAILKKVDIINLSLAGPTDPLLEALINAALSMGVIVIAATYERPDYQNYFPVNIQGVIAVKSARSVKSVTKTSSYNSIVFAPGNNILTTIPRKEYKFMSGNSLAAAHISGIVALLHQLDMTITTEMVSSLLTSQRKILIYDEIENVIVNACAAASSLSEEVNCQSKFEIENNIMKFSVVHL